MAAPINGTKNSKSINPGTCVGVNATRERIGEMTTEEVNAGRHDWAKGDAAAKDKSVATKTDGGKAVGQQFQAKRS